MEKIRLLLRLSSNISSGCGQIHTIIEKERVYDFLAGLNVEYGQFGSGSWSNPLSLLWQAYFYVQQEESHRSFVIHPTSKDKDSC